MHRLKPAVQATFIRHDEPKDHPQLADARRSESAVRLCSVLPSRDREGVVRVNPTRVLLVDEEPHARRVFRSALAMHGFETSVAGSGEEALEQLDKEPVDVILLHWNTPGNGGVATCRAVRKHSEIPMIVVSAPPAGRARIESLDAGADDFLTKPFAMNELAARIRAVTRRWRPTLPRLVLDDLEVDLQSREVTRAGVALHLSAKEFKLLDYLLAHAGEVLPHRRLIEAVWGPDRGDEVEYLRVLVNQLRKKLEPQPARPKYILTEPHIGYRFRISLSNQQGANA